MHYQLPRDPRKFLVRVNRNLNNEAMDLKTYGKFLALLASRIKQRDAVDDVGDLAAHLSRSTLLCVQRHILDSSTQIPVDFVEANGEITLTLATIWPRNRALEDALMRSLKLLDEIKGYGTQASGGNVKDSRRPQTFPQDLASHFEFSITECVQIIEAGVAKIESRESVLEGGNSAGFPQAQYSYPMTKAEIARVRNGSPGARGRQAKQFMADQECRPAKGSKQKFEVRLDTMESNMRRRFKSFDPFSAH